MMRRLRRLVVGLALLLTGGAALAAEFNVREHGAVGDGVALDSPAINRAIDAAATAGGGIVRLPPGRYLSFSLRLKSHVTLQLDDGAVLVAADPAGGLGTYDAAEPNASTEYQDFGHSHWHNSLIWGEDLEDIAIVGAGRIDGTAGLTRGGPPPRRNQSPNAPSPERVAVQAADVGPAAPSAPFGSPTFPADARPAEVVAPSPAPGASTSSSSSSLTPPPATSAPARRGMDGLGNKAIALKNCRGVTLRGFSVLNGGHFALLATGVDRLVIERLTVDTNRDGFDIDCCRDVRIADCTVNSPNDDAIVLKTSYALNERRATEDVVIERCRVSGFDLGSVLDGSRRRTLERAPDRDGPTGRIKLGTESNGDFRRIAIRDCTFERSRGLAIESVDGGTIEDVVVRNLALREIVNPPIFVRLGNRARGPAGTPVGAIRRVSIADITVEDSDARYATILLAGLPGHPIEELAIERVTVRSRGGLTVEEVAAQPAELVNSFFLRGTEAGVTGPRDPSAVPERSAAYPEPSMFGLLPASVVYARHVRVVELREVAVEFAAADSRTLFFLEDATGVRCDRVAVKNFSESPPAAPPWLLREAPDFLRRGSPPWPDTP